MSGVHGGINTAHVHQPTHVNLDSKVHSEKSAGGAATHPQSKYGDLHAEPERSEKVAEGAESGGHGFREAMSKLMGKIGQILEEVMQAMEEEEMGGAGFGGMHGGGCSFHGHQDDEEEFLPAYEEHETPPPNYDTSQSQAHSQVHGQAGAEAHGQAHAEAHGEAHPEGPPPSYEEGGAHGAQSHQGTQKPEESEHTEHAGGVHNDPAAGMHKGPRELYDRLGVDKTADSDQIKKGYRREALKHHPDKNGGTDAAKENFQGIGRAHEILSNQTKRQAYDGGLIDEHCKLTRNCEYGQKGSTFTGR